MLALVACSTASTLTRPPTEVTVPRTSTTVAVASTLDRADLTDWEPVQILVGDLPLTVALADEESERQLGLSGVEDLGDFEGMLFAWDQEVTTGFWMKDTHISLDLFFFGADGALVDQTSLTPCQAEPCPVFVADGLFRWVLEAPAGSVDSRGKLSFPEAG